MIMTTQKLLTYMSDSAIQETINQLRQRSSDLQSELSPNMNYDQLAKMVAEQTLITGTMNLCYLELLNREEGR